MSTMRPGRSRRRPEPARSQASRTLVRLLSLACLLLAGVGIAQPSGEQVAQDARSIPSHRAASNVAIISIKGPIDAVTSLSVERRIQQAESAGADAIVIELDTPGGEVGAVLEICAAIDGSSIGNTVAWIHDEAYSGGAIVAMACREIVVSRAASFGDAKVVGYSPMVGMIEPDTTQKEKLYPVLFERIDAFTKRRNAELGRYARDELLSQAIVADDAELWWVRDTASGVEFAIDRAEYERLFPDLPILQPSLADAAVGSVLPPPEDEGQAPAEPGAKPGSEPDAEPVPSPEIGPEDFRPVSPSVAEFADQTNARASVTEPRISLRPEIDFNDPARYVLLDKLLSGRGAAVIGADAMGRYGFAANVGDSGLGVVPISSEQQLAAFFGSPNIERFDMSWSERLTRFLSSLPVKALLVIVFLLGLFVEMMNPGMVLPGAVSLLALLGLVIPPFLIGAAGWWAVAAILGGIVLILMEIFVFPGFGIPGALGLLALFAGLLGVFIGDTTPSFPGAPPPTNQTDVLYSLATLLLSGGVSIGGMVVIAKNFGRLPVISKLILRSETDPDQPTLLSAMAASEPMELGREGVTLTVLRPSGTVQLDAEEAAAAEPIDVVSLSGYIDAGVRVKVVEADGFRVVVEPIRNDA